jgi:hypothetical protein
MLGVMTSGTFSHNAACLLERAGLSHLNVRSKSNNTAFFQEANADENAAKTRTFLMSFYTKESAEAVYKAYRKDYELFHLPRPDWIDDAHGSLYNDVKATKCTPSAASFVATDTTVHSVDSGHGALEQVLEANDADDISTIADRNDLAQNLRCLVVTELADTPRHKHQFVSLFHASWQLMSSAVLPSSKKKCIVDLMVFCEPEACKVVPDTCNEVKRGKSPTVAGPRCYYQVLGDAYADKDYHYGLSLNFMTTDSFEKAIHGYDFVMRSDVDAILAPGLRNWVPEFGSAVGRGFMGSNFTQKRLELIAKRLGLNHYGIHGMQSTFYIRASKVVRFARMLVNLSNHFFEHEFTNKSCEEVRQQGGDCKWPDWYQLTSTLYATDLAANHVLGEPEFKAAQVTPQLDHGATEYFNWDWHDHGDIWQSELTASQVAQLHLLSLKHHIGNGFIEDNANGYEKLCEKANKTWPAFAIPKTPDWGTPTEAIATYFMRVLSHSLPTMCKEL